ncbi:MAG: nuclear transport factor 2 family protein [Deltaproteobacteria bacterium]
MMTTEEARAFTDQWLPSWTGNNPERLLAFYADDAFFLDPGRPAGIKGKEKLTAYFTKVVGHNPTWVWTQLEPMPLQDGFMNKLHAHIPIGDKVIECTALCFIQFNSEGKIRRNEIYFDRTDLVREINKFRQSIAH